MFQSPDRDLNEFRTGFGGRKIIVVGDLMLDRYLWGQVERISPEAPVPIVKLQRETFTAGGAANVARNLAALGLDVHLAGVTGRDDGRENLLATLASDNIRTEAVIASEDRPTTGKTRVIGNHQQMIRIDEEHTDPLLPDVERELFANGSNQIPGAKRAGTLRLCEGRADGRPLFVPDRTGARARHSRYRGSQGPRFLALRGGDRHNA